MIVVRGKQRAELSRVELDALIAKYTGVTIDVGAGDGAWAYRYAKANASRFVIALDPVGENLREYSARAARKPARGGLANLLCITGTIEQPPEELRAMADELYVTLPWGSLMRGLVVGEDTVLKGLASLGREGARLHIVLNTRIFDEPVPLEARDLPEPTPEYVRAGLSPKYVRSGIRIEDARVLDAGEVAALDTTWAKRLSHRHPPPSVRIEARLIAPPGD
jgi:16S rRNA (adenine(1408)-N(1))-methyltransferase